MDTRSLDAAIQDLQARKDAWAQLAIPAKRKYLAAVRVKQAAIAEAMVAAAAEAKKISPGPIEAEDWAGGPYCILRYTRSINRTLQQIETHGEPLIGRRTVRTLPNGKVAVRVFPEDLSDRLLYAGFTGEVWMRSGLTANSLRDATAQFYRNPRPSGKVNLVLGAGNVAGIGPLDVLTKLYVEGKVSLLKLNPVNQYLGPFIENFLSDFIRDGFVRIAYGGADVGQYLCDHPGIEEIHITGSHLTHDAIVFGPGEEGLKRKLSSDPRLKKPITSELGNVSPVIVVPGPWKASDLRFHAANIATQMINNCGFNCCAAKVLVLQEGWPQAATLKEELMSILAAAPRRNAYYPGAEERYDRFVSSVPNARVAGPRTPGILPWTLIPDLPPVDATNLCYTTESFCGLMAQTSLPETDNAGFLDHAVEFCNDSLWGTLSACVIVHPETERELGARFENAIAALRYGTIGINHWPGLSFVLGSTTWGAFPGHTFQDIQSGIGVVHNSRLFDQPEKTVIRGPFRMWPEPAWFVTNRAAHKIFRKLVQFEKNPNFINLATVIGTAIRG